MEIKQNHKYIQIISKKRQEKNVTKTEQMGQIENNLKNVRINTSYIVNDIKCKWPKHSK